MALQGQTSTQVEHPDGHFSGKNSISPSKSFSTVMASVGQFRLHQVQVQQRSLSMSTLPWILSLSTVRSTVMHSSGQASTQTLQASHLVSSQGRPVFASATASTLPLSPVKGFFFTVMAGQR